MIIAFPDTLTADNWQELRLTGALKFSRSAPGVWAITWEFGDISTVLIVDVPNRTIDLPADADPAFLDILQAALSRFGQPPADLAIYNQVRTLAQSAVGVSLTDLTAGQRNALIAILLWERKAINADGKIRPLGEWVKRRRE